MSTIEPPDGASNNVNWKSYVPFAGAPLSVKRPWYPKLLPRDVENAGRLARSTATRSAAQHREDRRSDIERALASYQPKTCADRGSNLSAGGQWRVGLRLVRTINPVEA